MDEHHKDPTDALGKSGLHIRIKSQATGVYSYVLKNENE